MGLNSRQVQMLQALSRSAAGIPLEGLLRAERISKRTLYYDINAVNDFCAKNGLGKVAVHAGCVRGEDVDWVQVGRLLAQQGKGHLAGDERRFMMLVSFALSDGRFTIASLMEAYGVSRNTVLADIREMRRSLAAFGITLSSSAETGYRLSGDEGSVRRAIWSALQTTADVEMLASVRSFMQSELVSRTGEDIDFFELCRCLIKQFETDCSTKCFLDENGLESTMVQVSWLRSLGGHPIEMGPDEQSALMGSLPYRSVQRSAAKLRESGILLPEEELLYIASLLLGIKSVHSMGQREEGAYVVDLAECLASSFERVACLNYVDKELVVKQMSHHVRPLYYRLKYGLQVDNPLLGDIQRVYPMTYEFTRRATLLAGLNDLSADEIAYLTIYLTAGLDRTMLEEGDTNSSKVLVVGADSMSAITLLRQQLLDACGMKFEYSFASLGEIRRWELDRYALVISLVSVPERMASDNMVETGPFLTDEGLRRIFGVLRRNRIISRYNPIIDDIMRIVKGSLDRGAWGCLNEDKLYFELFRHFNERDYSVGDEAGVAEEAPSLAEGAVHAPEGATWQDMVMEGCRSICKATGSSLLPDRMVNLMKSARLQWYRMAADTVLVHCPMQGDKSGRVLAQTVTGGGSIPR